MPKMYVDKTKELFADLIQRPPLTDQLLQRPPFRFLHDVVKATIQNTGFLMDKFTSEQMDASNITDKTAKTIFLKTLIKALNDDGSLKDVKASKIIAGKEPEMTNLMLQKLAIDAAKFRNSKVNVKEEKKEKKVHKKERSSKKMERRNSSNEGKKKEKEERHSSKGKEKKNKGSEIKSKIIKQTDDSSGGRRGSIDEGHFEGAEPEALSAKMEQKIQEVHTDQEASGTAKTEDSGIAENASSETEQPLLSPVLKEQIRLSTSSGRPRTSAGRLGTAAARPPPPKLKKKQVAEIERKPEHNTRKTNGVIVDERKESDEYFIVEVEPSYDQTDQANAGELNAEEHGGLVRKILETKKELEEKISKEAYNTTTSVFDKNDQARSQEKLANLQRIMQQITQTTHLLARLLDNTQEDAENMFKEMEEWRSESTKNLRELRERKANVEGSSENLLLRLNQLDEQIKEVKRAIVQTKANVIANEEKIRLLINNI
uniref:TRAF3-interacting protein 1 n=1 Tax=Setaria digitata TaxID=48799 RepID=A0A915PXM5_9BILA